MPRATGSEALRQVLDQYTRRLGITLERFITGRIDKEVKSGKARKGGRRKRPPARCYFPGCKNIAAPRFGMFCAKLHKGLAKADKARYRAQQTKRKK